MCIGFIYILSDSLDIEMKRLIAEVVKSSFSAHLIYFIRRKKEENANMKVYSRKVKSRRVLEDKVLTPVKDF